MKKTTQTKWRQHYEDWQASGQTQRAYCEAVGIKHTTFKNYPKRIQRVDRKLEEAQKFGSFQPIELEAVEQMSRAEPYCQIAFSNGDEIVVSTENAMSRLRELVRCLS